MKKLFLILCFWCIWLHGIETDFDSVVVGTSPFSMFEALYKKCLGEKVLVIEQAAECGGAWKSITICGVPHADLGCHELGKDPLVIKFLEDYAGCRMVNLNADSSKPIGDGAVYPSKGCYELVSNLEYLMQSLGVVLLLNTKLESLFADTSHGIVEIRLKDTQLTTKKVVLTDCSTIKFDHPQIQNEPSKPRDFYHVGMLIDDPTPPRFGYRNLRSNGAMRATNYTLFSSELKGTGKQIITVQVLNERKMNNTDLFLADLKNQGLLDPSAQLLKIEKYSYRQNHLDQEALKKLGPEAQELFEILKTTHITNLSSYIEKWKTALKLWSEMTAQIPDPYPQVPFLEGGEAKPDGSVSSTNGEAHS